MIDNKKLDEIQEEGTILLEAQLQLYGRCHKDLVYKILEMRHPVEYMEYVFYPDWMKRPKLVLKKYRTLDLVPGTAAAFEPHDPKLELRSPNVFVETKRHPIGWLLADKNPELADYYYKKIITSNIKEIELTFDHVFDKEKLREELSEYVLSIVHKLIAPPEDTESKEPLLRQIK